MSIFILIIIVILYYYITINTSNKTICYKHNIAYDINKYNCHTLLKQPLLNTIITNRYYYYFNYKYTNYFNRKVEYEKLIHDNENFLLSLYLISITDFPPISFTISFILAHSHLSAYDLCSFSSISTITICLFNSYNIWCQSINLKNSRSSRRTQ